ncbi:EAL domain-containing protein [Lichenibacterium minor]|uniref:EAL domain-containing protein n=1 Tax=Lichenibacterium minor TaxID=2316528 RepID=A0A4Q2U070_9HYPH|nr:EAL domain-containing protein [Lichenibacterium minor]RYC29018.1 EAL domain-containing protein [Lichenibacterium minor]
MTVALALVRQVFSQIRDPLRSITAALSKLASGSLAIEVPQLDRRDEIGEMASAFEVFRNNAMALAEARKLADGLASYDALTGLANRRLLASIIGDSVNRAISETSAFAVMLLDLDRFKAINDLKGHAAGDAALCEVAARVRAVIGDRGTVARLGGDEFAVLIFDVSAEAERCQPLSSLAAAIIATVREPIDVLGGQVHVGVSIGIALFPSDGQDAEGLLRAADLAMYRAKKEGAGLVHFFEPAMIQDMEAQSALESDVRHALRSGQIRPSFQPIVDLVDGRIAGFEILARWQHPVRGFVPPDVFVPLLDGLGLSEALTAAMLRQACRHARAWGRHARLAINVSPAEFQNAGLPSLILDILADEGIDPSDLAVEVTETAVLQDINAARRTVSALRDSGIEIVLDDFGTGYASLHYLKELRFDKLKIDRSFIQSLQKNPMSLKIVESVLHLARGTGIATVAEGIEDDQTLADLVRLGCDFGQGFHFSKAVEAELAKAMLIEGSTAISGVAVKAA